MIKMLRELLAYWWSRLTSRRLPKTAPIKGFRYRVITRADSWSVHGPSGWIKIPRDGRWSFNGDLEYPTFRPSVVESWDTPEGGHYCNHAIIRSGSVQYLHDCTHEFAGKKLELIPLTEVEEAFYYARTENPN